MGEHYTQLFGQVTWSFGGDEAIEGLLGQILTVLDPLTGLLDTFLTIFTAPVVDGIIVPGGDQTYGLFAIDDFVQGMFGIVLEGYEGGGGGGPPPPPIEGSSGGDWLDGTDGDDIIHGNGGADTFFADAGDDTLVGGADYDQVNFATGLLADFDFSRNADGTITVSNATFGTDQLENIDGFWFDEEGVWIAADELVPMDGIVVAGTDGNDILHGNPGDDTILGGAGNDVLWGGRGDDTLAGGGGDYNQVNYDGASGDYAFIRNADGTIMVTSAMWGFDTLIGIDGFWFNGEGAWYNADALAGAFA